MQLTSMITPQVSKCKPSMAWGPIYFMVVITSLSQTCTDESMWSCGTVYLLLFQKGVHMPPLPHTLKAIEDKTYKGFPRALCRVYRRLCSGPASGGEGGQSCAAFGNLPFLDRFGSCHAAGFWERCRTSSVTLNAGGSWVLHVCWADCGDLAERGFLRSFAVEEGICFLTYAVLSAVTVLKAHTSAALLSAVVTVLFSHSPMSSPPSTLLQWADEEPGIQPTFQDYLESFETLADWEDLVHSWHPGHKKGHDWGNSSPILWYLEWAMSPGCPA